MKTLPFLSLLVVLTAVMACDTADSNRTSRLSPKILDVPPLVSDLNDSGADFGIGLFTRTAGNAAEKHPNLMLSPLSAQVALTMLLNGSKGDTYEQIHRMLGYAPDADLDAVNQAYSALVKELLKADPKVALTLANAVFQRDGSDANPVFLNTMKAVFGAHYSVLDFDSPSAVTAINQWASEKTNKRIPKVLERIEPGSVMFLLNALYFKGAWTTPFEKAQTRPADFTKTDGRTAPVPTMHGEVTSVIHEGAGYRAIEIPYGRRNFSMVVILPDGSLIDFYDRFSGGTWRELTQALDARSASDEWPKNELHLPRFSFEYGRTLNDHLQTMGMTDAFDEALANLSGISDVKLVVSSVKQNTFVDVNEEGTEAAAVTTVDIRNTSVPIPFQVNRPFIFAIRERTTNTLLFIGQVTDPAS
jgi:serine protease inhibitor